MSMAIVPRIPRRRRRDSRWPLLLRIIGFRIRLRATLWRYQIGQKVELAWIVIGLGWLWADLKATRALLRLINWLSPPRK